jgi:hypothetical protein
MTQKLWQKNWKLNCSKDVIDIALFGSAILSSETTNDIDIVVLFKKIPVKEQLQQSQEIKKQIQEQSSLPVHIKSFDVDSFFDGGNFAREGILFYGKSVIKKQDFSENFGLSPKSRIYYALDKLEKKAKVKFNYLLSGRQGNYGLLRKSGGQLLAPGIIETSPENEHFFVEQMKKITKDIRVERCFISSD